MSSSVVGEWRPPSPAPPTIDAPALPAIRARGLGKRYELYAHPHQRLLQTVFRGRRQFYREFWALTDVTFDVAKGETVGIVGRNGSGKSTLLQMIAGTLRPTTGGVDVAGRVAALLELGSGFDPEFTGRENVFLNGAILGIPRREMEAQFAAIAAFADIGTFIDEPVKTYSSGMRMRLAFAVAVHVTPDILILDEVLAVGDTAFAAKCLNRIRRMQGAGVAMLLVSHSRNTVIEFCDRAVYLDAGRMIAQGPCRDILEMYGNDMLAREGGVALPSVAAGAMPPLTRVSDAESAQAASAIVAVAITTAAGVAKECYSHGEELHVAFDVEFRQDNPAPCLGIHLRSSNDIGLWTATTQAMGVALAPAAAGECRRYSWRLHANCGGARYVVALGVGDVAEGTYRRHSHLHYAGHFDVLSRAGYSGGWLEPAAALVDWQSPPR